MPDLQFEHILTTRGFHLIAGVDEAGRGPLAGPVAAAAVILPPHFELESLDDSKKLSARKRDALYEKITQHPDILWSVALANVEEIEQLNILAATHLAMNRALAGLSSPPDYCLVDGLPVKSLKFPHDAIVKGDSKSLSIAAASIIAKVTRDRIMLDLDLEFPQYGFAKHQGYGTKQHLQALQLHGPCRHHRRTFQPVAQLTLPFDSP